MPPVRLRSIHARMDDRNVLEPQVFARFDGFPMGDRPRPVILLDRPVKIGDRGFIDVESKLAWLNGAIDAAVPLADGVIELLSNGQRRDIDMEPLMVTETERIERRFLCDRGRRRLPAYRLVVSGMYEPVTVIDPTISTWWPLGGPLHATALDYEPARISKNGLTLQIPARGGFLTSFHRAEFDEHENYVIATAITSERPTSAIAIPLVGVAARVSGRLRAPLGGRVLLRPNGHPLAVLPAQVPQAH